MSDDKELYHLMANPWKINRTKRKQESYINREFINLLKKKYPSYIIEDSDINIIFENLEDSLLNKITISKEDIKELYNLEVVLILKDGENKFFPENTINIDLKNNDMLLLFLNDLRKKDFMNNCKPNLRT